MTQHIPNRGEHIRHYFGYYSNAARGKRKKRAAQAASSPACVQATGASTEGAVAVADGVSPDADADTQDFRRECRRTWARLIQRVYEVNPLICPHCGSTLEVVAFIDAPATIQKILQHLHLWDLPARPPPAPLLERKTDALLVEAGRPRLRDEARIDPPSVADIDAPLVDDVPTYTD